jgi:hypothetical protein
LGKAKEMHFSMQRAPLKTRRLKSGAMETMADKADCFETCEQAYDEVSDMISVAPCEELHDHCMSACQARLEDESA